MTDTGTEQVNQRESEPSKWGHILVGSAIDNKTDEQFVALHVSDGGARLSPEGARLIAKQLVEWADHAEKKNSEPTTVKLMYRILHDAVDKNGWRHVEQPATEAQSPAAESMTFKHEPSAPAKKEKTKRKR